MFEIKWILGRIRKGEYYFSKHGDQERQNDNLTIAEVEEALLGGKILEQYEDSGRGEVVWLQDLQTQGNQYTSFVAGEGIGCDNNCVYTSSTKI